MSVNYTEFIDGVKAELIDLKGRRGSLELEKADVEAKMDTLSKTLTALAPMASPDEAQTIKEFLASMGETAAPAGITDRIRAVLKSTLADQLSPAEVRDALQSRGWDLGRYANAASTIQTILKRLVEMGEAIEIPTNDGKKYRAVKR